MVTNVTYQEAASRPVFTASPGDGLEAKRGLSHYHGPTISLCTQTAAAMQLRSSTAEPTGVQERAADTFDKHFKEKLQFVTSKEL